MFFPSGMTQAKIINNYLITEPWPSNQTAVGVGKVMHSNKCFVVVSSIASMETARDCPCVEVFFPACERRRTLFGDHLWRCRAHPMAIRAALRVVNRKSLNRHDNAMHLRWNGVNRVPEPQSNFFFPPWKSKESLPFSLSHVMILVSRTGCDRGRLFVALIRPLIASCGMTVAWPFPSYRCNPNK